MQVFLSWSGERSRAVAEALKWWLSQVIQAVDPWLSADTTKGMRWGPEIAGRLEASRFGIVCLTPENLHEDWVLFEAGALSKTNDAHVCTFLLDLNPADVIGPLAQFQHTMPDVTDARRLIQDINEAVGKASEKKLTEDKLRDAFDAHWPRFAEKIDAAQKLVAAVKEPPRSVRQIVEEILDIARRQERLLTQDSGAGAMRERLPAHLRPMFGAARKGAIIDEGNLQQFVAAAVREFRAGAASAAEHPESTTSAEDDRRDADQAYIDDIVSGRRP